MATTSIIKITPEEVNTFYSTYPKKEKVVEEPLTDRELNKQRLDDCFNKGYRVIDGDIYNKGNKLKPKVDKQGYLFIRITDRYGKMRELKLHRLVAYEKYGEAMFEPGIMVRHLDDVKTNNAWDNLVLGTNSDNQQDIPAEKRRERSLKSARSKYNKN